MTDKQKKTCPTPEKKKYTSKRTAVKAIKLIDLRRADGGPGRLHAYNCIERSHWHVGHI